MSYVILSAVILERLQNSPWYNIYIHSLLLFSKSFRDSLQIIRVQMGGAVSR